MSTQIDIILILILVSIVFFLLWRKTANKLSKVKWQKQSLSTKYGKINEQFLPFLDVFPYDPSGFRFLGSPIDGVQFEEDKIIFFEFKSGTSRLMIEKFFLKKYI
jgi:hypothetical protein